MNPLSKWMNRSLGRRITVLASLLLILVGGAIFAVSYFQVVQLTHEVAAERLRVAGRRLADRLGRSPAATTTALTRLAADPALTQALADSRHRDTAGAAQLLRASLPATGRSVYTLVDPEGIAALAIGPASQPDWFGPPAESAQETASAGPFTKLGDSVLYMDTKVPVSRQGKFLGSLVQRSRIAMSAEGWSTLRSLVGPGTKILVGSSATGAWTDLGRVVPPPAESLHRDSVVTLEWDGSPHMALSLAVPGVPWDVVVLTSQSIVEAPAAAYLRRALLVAVLAVVAGTLGAAALGTRLSRPIREITQVTERIASGEEDPRADEDSPGEFGRLARSFNVMVEEVAHSARRLRESETSLRAFVAQTSQGIWHVEFSPPLDTRMPPSRQIGLWYERAPLAECNQTLGRMLGVEVEDELGSIPFTTLLPPADPQSLALLEGFIAQGYRCSQVQSVHEREGQPAQVFVNDMIGVVEASRLRRIWGTRREVTLERMLDERLAQSQRLESIGRLAGGVAHDFNNLLTVVLAHSELLLERLPENSEERAGAAEIQETALRAAQLTRQLLLFSRGQVARPRVLELNAVVSSVEAMLRRVLGEDVELSLRLAPRLAHIRADQGQIEQVIMNLVVNARDAMPSGGSLELRTDELELDEEYVRLHPTTQPGRYVMLAITDTGAGMTPQVQQHAFEPFYTTKPKGRGTGLGLATVYGVVRQGGGDVAIYSEVGKGTTVRVFFPAHVAADDSRDEAAPRGAPATVSGTETVMVIEDEPALRDMARRALTSSGYRVLSARDGAEALRLADEHLDRIDLLLTDMILPGMSGRELVGEFRRRKSSLPVIIMSGYTGETYPDLDSLPVGVDYLEKPFTLSELRQRVREVIDGAPA